MRRPSEITKTVPRGKLTRLGVLAFTLVLVLTAFSCTSAKVQYGDVDQNLTEAELDIKGSVVLTVVQTSNEAESMSAKGVVNAFNNRYPGARAIYEEGKREAFGARISAGDIGDVFWVDPIDANNYQQNHNALMPLDSYLKPLNIDVGDVYSGVLDVGKIRGRLYMVPRNVGGQVLIYNKGMLESAGIDFDNSVACPWDDFKNICKQLTIIEDGQVKQAGVALKIWWEPIWQMFFRGFGGEWIDSKEHKVSIVSSNEVMTGVNEIITGIQEGWLYPEDMTSMISSIKYAIPDGDSDISHVCFKSFGAMAWLTSYGLMYDRLQIDWDFCTYPAFPTQNISVGATGYVVYNRTKNPDTAAALALFFMTHEGQVAYHSQTGSDVPVIKSLAEDDLWKGKGTDWEDKNYGAFVAYMDKTKPANPCIMAPFEVADVFSNDSMMGALARVINGVVDAQTAFAQLETKANQKWETVLS